MRFIKSKQSTDQTPLIQGGVGVVTGAGSGIGQALAHELARRGAALALTDLNPDGLENTAQACRSLGARVSVHVFDVGDPAAVAALPEQVQAAHGRVNLLINNAGVALAGDFEQTSLADFEWLMNINFWGPVRLCKAFLPMLHAAPTAQIVNISSLFGLIAPEGQAAYCASKFGLRGFSESLRHELAGGSIGLTVVHPGGVRTNIAANARMPRGANSAEAEAELRKVEALLVTPPARAAQLILDGAERRAPRVLIGSDAKKADVVQRLFPSTYWDFMRPRRSRRRRA